MPTIVYEPHEHDPRPTQVWGYVTLFTAGLAVGVILCGTGHSGDLLPPIHGNFSTVDRNWGSNPLSTSNPNWGGIPGHPNNPNYGGSRNPC